MGLYIHSIISRGVAVNPNSDQIVHDIRAQVESLLTTMTGTQAQTMTADAIERVLVRQVLEIGRLLLYLFLVWRAQTSPQQASRTPMGVDLPFHAHRRRTYRSIFGAIRFWRPYFYRASQGGDVPLDAALQLPRTSWSDLVREHVAALVVQIPYRKAGDILHRLVGVKLSTHTMADMIAEAAADVPAFYTQQPAPVGPTSATILVAQADGKGVPMRQPVATTAPVRRGKGAKANGKKEALVTALYTIAPRVRTPQQVIDSLFKSPTPPTDRARRTGGARTAPQQKRLWVTLQGKDAAIEELARQLHKRDSAHIQHRVALTDGSEPLQQRMRQYCPTYTLVLDLIHAVEYLWQAANALLGETHPQRTGWVADRVLQVLSGRTDAVIANLRDLAQAADRTATQTKVLLQVAGYLQRNLPYMHYDEYLRQGWPIATGVIEGACRHLVKDRCELSGMRWTQTGAEALLHLRCVYENGDWEAYHAFRRQRRRQRRDGPPGQAHILAFPAQPCPALAA